MSNNKELLGTVLRRRHADIKTAWTEQLVQALGSASGRMDDAEVKRQADEFLMTPPDARSA